jgi:hypothetical protein
MTNDARAAVMRERDERLRFAISAWVFAYWYGALGDDVQSIETSALAAEATATRLIAGL